MTTMENPVRNGVDTATLFATLDAVKANPDIAKFQFRATNRWVSGTHNQSTIHGFYGAMQEMTHQQAHVYDADHGLEVEVRSDEPTQELHPQRRTSWSRRTLTTTGWLAEMAWRDEEHDDDP